jgi:ribosomal protein S16
MSIINEINIRLKRRGCKHYPLYDIIVCLKKIRRDGAYIEKLGYYIQVLLNVEFL